jgi:hypothetical protein
MKLDDDDDDTAELDEELLESEDGELLELELELEDDEDELDDDALSPSIQTSPSLHTMFSSTCPSK